MALAIILFIAGCGSAPTKNNAVVVSGIGEVLEPGDVLQVTVWKEDGLDRETLVLPDGSIDFPLVGSLPAGGRTTQQVADEIRDALVPKFMNFASVAVAVKASLGHTVDVIGQVNKPGELIPGHRVSVMQALSMAGGLTPYASHGKIIILRRDNGTETAIPFPYDDVSEGKALDKDVILQWGDVIFVPEASLF